MKKRLHVAWFCIPVAIIFILSTVLVYQNSWIPDYGEAEPLFPVVKEFGKEVVALRGIDEITLDDLRSLSSEDRFKSISEYGFYFPDESGYFMAIRVNKTFSFYIKDDGYSEWRKQ